MRVEGVFDDNKLNLDEGRGGGACFCCDSSFIGDNPFCGDVFWFLFGGPENGSGVCDRSATTSKLLPDPS
jgi:hypothetical protein